MDQQEGFCGEQRLDDRAREINGGLRIVFAHIASDVGEGFQLRLERGPEDDRVAPFFDGDFRRAGLTSS